MKTKELFIGLLVGLVMGAAPACRAEQVMPSFETKYVDRYVISGWYWLRIVARDMESAVAQTVNFYESRGWGVNGKKLFYSGIPLIYEYAPFPEDVKKIDDNIVTASIGRSLDFVTNKSMGSHRTQVIDNRVVIVWRYKGSLLYNLNVDSMDFKGEPFIDAMRKLLSNVNQNNRKYRIRLEVLEVIRPRAALGTPDWAIFTSIKKEELQRKIHADIAFGTLANALAEVLMSQPIPYYLTLRPDTQGSKFTHVMKFDTLPEDMPRAVIPKNATSSGRYYLD